MIRVTRDIAACRALRRVVFIEEDGVLITPPLSEGVMAGITRLKIIEKFSAKEEPISEKRLRAASRVFLTNSFWGFRQATLIY